MSASSSCLKSKLKVGETRSVVKLEASDYQTAPAARRLPPASRARSGRRRRHPNGGSSLLQTRSRAPLALDFSLDTNDMESLTYEPPS